VQSRPKRDPNVETYLLSVELRVLGPLEVIGPAGPLNLGGAKMRAVLAVLAVHVGQPVADGRLIEALWGDEEPRTAERTLRTYVSRLRRTLSAAQGRLLIETTPAGYRLQAAPDALDVARVEDLAEQGRQALDRGDHAWAAVAFSEALRAWHGEPLAEFAGEPWATSEVARLTELRDSLLEARVDAELACGRHIALVPELEALTAAHPLRERLWEQRMLALYRSGRQSDALRVYQELRTLLADELGLEPAASLRQLETGILAQDPALQWMPPLQDAVPSPLPATALDAPSGVITFLLTSVDGVPDEQALRRHDEILAEAIAAAGGRVVSTKGELESTMSVFRRPSDAVAAATTILTSCGDEPWNPAGDLAVRIAVHTGEVELADAAYHGTTVERARWMRGIAAPGQVVISSTTAALVRDDLPAGTTIVDLGAHSLPDLSRDERLFGVVLSGDDGAAGPAGSRWTFARRLELGSVDAFVGRRHEVDLLREHWGAVERGGRRAVLVAGEPGIGKTSLVAQVARQLTALGGIALYGRCDEDLGAAYQPFSEALGEYVTNCPLWELRDYVTRSGGDLARIVPQIRRRVPTIPPAPQTDPEAERFQLFDSVVGLLAGISRHAPVVLVLDDLQWATKPTLMLLRHIVRTAEPLSLLVVGTYRDTELGRTHELAELLADLRNEPDVSRMTLQGLEVADVSALIGEDVTGLAQTLHERTQGNPFFIGEVLRHLADGDAAEQRLPEGVREVISRRLARLSPGCNHMLTVAAVLGLDFDLALVEQVLRSEPDEVDVVDAFDEAMAARVLVEFPDQPGRSSFAHALIRETLYAALTTARRVRLHRRVGEAMESMSFGRAQLDALAHHFAEAAVDGQSEKAVAYGFEAARAAFSQLAFEKAIQDAERALAVVQDDQQAMLAGEVFELLVLVVKARARLLDRENAKADALVAMEHARASGSAERVAAVALAVLEAGTGTLVRDAVVDALAEEAVAASVALDPPQRARLLATCAGYRAQRGYDSEDDAAQALAIARDAGDASALASALEATCWSLQGTHRLDELVAASTELLALACSTDDRIAQGHARYFRGTALLAQGDRGGFDADIDALAEVADGTRSALNRAQVALARVCQAQLDGRFDEIEALASAALMHGGDDPGFAQAYGAQMFFLAHEQGRLAELQPLLAALASEDHVLPGFKALVALIHAELGAEDEARAIVAELAVDDFQALQHDQARAVVLLPLATTAVRLGDQHLGAALRRIHAEYRGTVLTVSAAVCFGSADRFLGMLAALQGDAPDAIAHFDVALELEQRLGSPPLLARTRYWYAKLLIDSGQNRPQALQMLADCVATAQALGMGSLLADARRLQRAAQ
jgi:DNA-binding SARP family transcriptional activator